MHLCTTRLIKENVLIAQNARKSIASIANQMRTKNRLANNLKEIEILTFSIRPSKTL